jgi:hemerythrin-like domain-containing protein
MSPWGTQGMWILIYVEGSDAMKPIGPILVDAKARYLRGENTSQLVIAYMKELAKFYPQHIEKEDKHFFYPSMEYFTKEEQDRMLNEFWEFDRKMIHEKYTKVVDLLIDESGKEAGI